jgi:hypothetical protein
MSLTDIPALCSVESSRPFDELPLATAMFLPRRSARLCNGESAGTRMASPVTPCTAAETTATLADAAAEMIGGVLPTEPMSTAPAEAASSSGGPEVNVDHSMR